MEHTPGPWVSRGRYVGTPKHMSFIAECRDQNGNWSNEPMAVANARLIAEAPSLLEHGWALAVAALQSDRYAKDCDFRNAVDALLDTCRVARGEPTRDEFLAKAEPHTTGPILPAVDGRKGR